MNWTLLYYGHVSPKEVQEAVKDAEWQKLRQGLKGTSLQTKYDTLLEYSDKARGEILMRYIIGQTTTNEFLREVRMLNVRLTNYVTALSRGGLIKPSDYSGVHRSISCAMEDIKKLKRAQRVDFSK